MSAWTTKTRIGAAALVALAVSATAAYAAGLQPDGTNLKSSWTNGGEAWLELEDRNALPALCFTWTNPAPQDGDSIASRILTLTGTEVVDLGVGDQWIDGSSSGCEIPETDSYREVFAKPSSYVIEVRVVENQGTPTTSAIRSQPLKPATG